MTPAPIEGGVLAAVCVLLATVVVFDLRQRRIPNALVAVLLAGGLAHGARGGWGGALVAVVGGVAGAALLGWPYAKGLVGGGDLKLLAAIGAWVGGVGAVMVLLLGSVGGGLLALALMARLSRADRAAIGHNVISVAMLRGAIPPASPHGRGRGVPLGVPLSVAAAAVLAFRSLS